MRDRAILVVIAAVMIALLTQPAAAVVVVESEDLGGCVVEFNYDSSGESKSVMAFALNITVDNEATIESIFNLNETYNIYPGEIDIGDPEPIGEGGSPGEGLGTGEITVEMGTLYDGGEPPPPLTGTLFCLSIDLHSASMANVDIALNTPRGGIVLEGGTCADADLRGCTVVPEPSTIFLLGFGGFLLRRRK